MDEKLFEVEVISTCAVISKEGWWSVPYEERTVLLEKWMEDNNSIYYAADRENFSEFEARKAAVKAGVKKVIVEDLS